MGSYIFYTGENLRPNVSFAKMPPTPTESGYSEEYPPVFSSESVLKKINSQGPVGSRHSQRGVFCVFWAFLVEIKKIAKIDPGSKF